MTRTTRHRLLIAIGSLVIIDLTGFITVVADPELTERIIPALFGMQIVGFFVIATVVVTGNQNYVSAMKAGAESRGTQRYIRQWVPWLFGFLALLGFLSSGLGLLSMLGEEQHLHSWFNPIAEAATGCIFVLLAIMTGRSVSKTK